MLVASRNDTCRTVVLERRYNCVSAWISEHLSKRTDRGKSIHRIPTKCTTRIEFAPPLNIVARRQPITCPLGPLWGRDVTIDE